MSSNITDRASGLGTGAIPNGENATISQKVPCRVATTANVTLAGLQTLDTVTVAADDRVLVKDQTDASENGIYLASADLWQRTSDCVDDGDLVRGSQVRVNQGALGPGPWYCTSPDPIVIGTDDITWADAASTDLSGAEIKALYEVEADAFTDAQFTKLAGIEPGATADQTDAEIQAAYNNQVSVVSQAEAEAGIQTTVRRWTALRVAQAAAANGGGAAANFVTSRTALKALDTSSITTVQLVEDGRSGMFTFESGNFATQVSGDTLEGVYIKADDTATTAGAWVRVVEAAVNVKWFGAVGNNSNDDTSAIQSALDYAAGGGSVFFPAGNYKVTSTLTITTSNTALLGEAARVTTIRHSGNYGDTISFSSASPLTNRIGAITIKDLRFFVDNGATLPTNGAHLHFVRPQNVELHNLHLSDHFGGLLFEGGAEVYISDLKVFSGQYYGSVQAGSYLMKFSPAATSGSNEFVSEYFISNFNVKANGAAYIADGIVIEASDGIWFSNGHVGFTDAASLRVQPVNATDSLNGVNFSNVHFDGNFNTERGVFYTESSPGFHTGACFGHTFTGCQVSICTGHGMQFNLNSLTGTSVTGGRINNNDGSYGIRMQRGSGFSVTGVLFKDNGDNLAGSGHVLIDNGVSDCRVEGIFRSTAYRGVQIANSANNIVVDGVFDGITFEDVFTSSSSDNISIRGVSDKSRTIASSAELQIPLFGDEFTITGNTTITSIKSASTKAEGRIITLRFNSTPQVTDGGNLVLAGTFNSTSNDTLTLRNMNGAWLELSRSAN